MHVKSVSSSVMSRTLATAVALASCTAASASGQTNPDTPAVRAVIESYFNGHAGADSALMRSVFLPTAHIEGLRAGAFSSQTVDTYAPQFKGPISPDEPSRKRTIDVVDITGTAAMVKATLAHSAGVTTDYFLLLKVNGAWKIANKVYHAERKAP